MLEARSRAGARTPSDSRRGRRARAQGGGGGAGRPYQINERQEFPAPSVGLMRGHFDGLVVAQDRAVRQQDRHPQHLARHERHVRKGLGWPGGEETGRKARGAPWEARRGGAGRGCGGARPSGRRPRVPERRARAGRRVRAPAAAAARRAAWRQLFRHLRHSAPASSGSRVTRLGAPPRCPGSVQGAPPRGRRGLGKGAPSAGGRREGHQLGGEVGNPALKEGTRCRPPFPLRLLRRSLGWPSGVLGAEGLVEARTWGVTPGTSRVTCFILDLFGFLVSDYLLHHHEIPL